MLLGAWIFHEYESLTPLFYAVAVVIIIIIANLLHPAVELYQSKMRK